MAWFRETMAGGIALLACTAALLAPASAGAAGPPLIKAVWVTAVNSSGAELHAEIEANGFAAKYRFEYITDAAYQANPPASRFQGAVSTPEKELVGQPSELLQHLPAATVFHYRAVAVNSAGTSREPELGHIFVTKEFGKTPRLPDGRAWEMVSPIDKGGGAIAFPEALFGGGDLQAAAAGAIVTYGSGSSFETPSGEAKGAPPVSQYVSHRTSGGWVTENVSAPLDSAAYGDHPDGAPYRVFSADLSRALLFGGLACRGDLPGCPEPNPPLPGSGAPAGYMAYYLRDGSTGSFASLLSPAEVAQSAVSPPLFEVSFAAAGPDLSHVLLSSCAKLTANATEIPGGPGSCDPSLPNLYEWSAGALALVNLRPGETVGTPGAQVAAPIGAVSSAGSRVYWTGGGNLYLREGAQTVQGDKPGGGGTFQTATPDGAFAFFIDATGHLLRYSAVGESTMDLTPAGGVVGALGVSDDGSYAYFQDAAGLKRWHEGAGLTTVAAGAEAAAPSDYPPATATARVSPDGLHLAFLSKAELTGFDNVDATTKLPDAELYVYGPPAPGGPSLICASCNPTGERPEGPASIPGALVNGGTLAYKPRAMSADGSRLFFDTGDSYGQTDSNKRPDVYEWEAFGAGECGRVFGCVSPLSKTSAEGGRFVDTSADGTDVYFLTGDSLVEADPGSIDLYDARAGGGFPEPPQPLVCLADACQPLPGEPDDPTPGTLVPNPGNPRLRILEARRKHKHHRKRHRRHRGAKHRHRADARARVPR